MKALRKYSAMLLMLTPIFLGIGVEHTVGSDYHDAIPVEQSQSEKHHNSLSETMEELSKEDEVHTYNMSILPKSDTFSNRPFYSGPPLRIVVLVPTPPPDQH